MDVAVFHRTISSATSSDWSARGSATRTSPPGCSSHRAQCKPTSLTRKWGDRSYRRRIDFGLYSVATHGHRIAMSVTVLTALGYRWG